MVRIGDVWMADMLCISLHNGQDVMIPIKSNPNAQLFTKIISGQCDAKPRTDGLSVYWRDGPRLTFEEIMGMVEADRS